MEAQIILHWGLLALDPGSPWWLLCPLHPDSHPDSAAGHRGSSSASTACSRYWSPPDVVIGLSTVWCLETRAQLG